MTQTIDTPLTTALSLVDEDVIVTTDGSIEVVDGPALSVSGSFSAVIFGALRTNTFFTLSVEGKSTADATIQSAGTVAGGLQGTGVLVGGAVSFVNNGTVSGGSVGIQTFLSVTYPTTTGPGITNYGSITGDSAVDIGNDGVRIVNFGQIIGDSFGIYSDVAGSVTQIDNGGTISGGDKSISSAGTVRLTNLSDVPDGIVASAANGAAAAKTAEPAGSIIVNSGTIAPGSDEVAIRLGPGDDRVTSTGVIEGKIRLRDGDDTAKIANSDTDIAAHIRGGRGEDKLVAGKSDDILFGGRGHDVIKAKAGEDNIVGGAGRDKIWTGRGEDLLVHKQGHGRDAVYKFKPGKDVLDITDHGFDGFADLISAMKAKNNHVHVHLSGNDKVVLKNLQIPDLSAEDFVL